jgi:hypothetical protein
LSSTSYTHTLQQQNNIKEVLLFPAMKPDESAAAAAAQRASKAIRPASLVAKSQLDRPAGVSPTTAGSASATAKSVSPETYNVVSTPAGSALFDGVNFGTQVCANNAIL